MSRPRTILWVDDEIASLDSQVLFLEQQGFAVERATNGDDALALLRRQPYGVVLLDEQMPGTRGLDLVPMLRSIDPSMPVVMVTKSEEPGTMRDAIGAEIADYLIKPVNPRQVLTVVTRLLEGDRIRQQRLSRDFVTRFRELEARRGETLAWREWVELIAELAEWEVRLGEADEPGLSEALGSLQRAIRDDFARFLLGNYPKWLAEGGADRPPLSVDVVSEFLRPTLDLHGKAMLVVVDCLRLDQWAMLRPMVERHFDIEVDHYFSILPTATPYARNAIFSGLYPAELVARHPAWWDERDEHSLNAHEAELLIEQLRELTGRDVPVHYEKMFSAADGEAMLRHLPSHLQRDGVTALVFNFIDQLTHGRTENEALLEMARDTSALRSLTRTWFERSALYKALKEAERRRVPVILTTDHGSIHCHTPATIFARRDATSSLRFKFGDDLRVDDPNSALLIDDFAAWGLPPRTPGARLALATGDRFFVYPTKLREYQARYRGAFLHGGVSPEEVVLPVALLMPRRS
ncbi:MAG TPA: response regulator [Gemmatimonadales bacterium]|nr:response regulator [Gemmatimonadales bacterium]